MSRVLVVRSVGVVGEAHGDVHLIGRSYVDDSLSNRTVACGHTITALSAITSRELDVLREMARGNTNAGVKQATTTAARRPFSPAFSANDHTPLTY